MEKTPAAKPARNKASDTPSSVTDTKPKDKRWTSGSDSEDWNSVVTEQVGYAMWTANSDEEDIQRQIGAICAGFNAIAPRDELESMMAAQLMAAHNAAMECYRRAMISNQSAEGRKENLNQANKLSRTWTALLEALNRHRGKGQQKMTVEHVHVHEGGQAVVGVVEAKGDGGGRKKRE